MKFYCKCCGQSFNDFWSIANLPCNNSPTKKHQVYEGTETGPYHCICCGQSFNDFWSIANIPCNNSPTKKHQPL
jgi:protein-arginine kinase activator protein McsA